MTRALSSGLCRELQSLDLRVFSTTDAELQHLASSLESGALPNLISLAITCCTPLVRHVNSLLINLLLCAV